MILGEKYDNKSPRTHLRTFKISLVICILQFFTQNNLMLIVTMKRRIILFQ